MLEITQTIEKAVEDLAGEDPGGRFPALVAIRDEAQRLIEVGRDELRKQLDAAELAINGKAPRKKRSDAGTTRTKAEPAK